MAEGSAGGGRIVHRPRPGEPGTPDDRVVGAPLGAAVEPLAGLVEPADLRGEARLRQPDAVVVRGPLCGSLDLGADHLEEGRGAIGPPMVAEVADRIGRYPASPTR